MKSKCLRHRRGLTTLTTDCRDAECRICNFLAHWLPDRPGGKRKSKSMIQGKEILISGGKLTSVEGDYHEHNTTYVIKEASLPEASLSGYLDSCHDRVRKIEGLLNNCFISPEKEDGTPKNEFEDRIRKIAAMLTPGPKEDNTKSDDRDSSASGQTVHSPSRVENMGDTSSSNHVTEIQFNSLNDPPQPTSESVFDDGYCIYQTPTTPNRINDFTANSRTFSATSTAQGGRNLPSGNQHPYPFGYMVPGVVGYFPCWLPSWGGWIASWISWFSPPWIWPSYL